MEVEFKSNRKEVEAEMRQAIEKALTMCGMTGERYAKENITKQKAVDTGNLRNSMTYRVAMDENAVYVGTNNEYAAYIELGTGAQNTIGGTPKPSWVYKGEDGEYHRAFPQPARPYLKPAVADHAKEYNKIIEETLKG